MSQLAQSLLQFNIFPALYHKDYPIRRNNNELHSVALLKQRHADILALAMTSTWFHRYWQPTLHRLKRMHHFVTRYPLLHSKYEEGADAQGWNTEPDRYKQNKTIALEPALLVGRCLVWTFVAICDVKPIHICQRL